MSRFVVVTPVLNGAAFIRSNLAAVQTQTDGDWIHYLVDGGSTDGTLEILAEAADTDRRRRVISGNDKGLYDALFKGFDQARTDGLTNPRTICVWLNADDLLMPWAFATLRQQFDQTGAEWISAYPSFWDAEGRLIQVKPYNWYPRALIRAGRFNPRSLGSIQQESVFFTLGLLSKLSGESVDRIRSSRLAGDFMLWRAFAEHADIVPIPTAVSGFRTHLSNLSVLQEEAYLSEVQAQGVRLPSPWLGNTLRACYRQLSLLKASGNGYARPFKAGKALISKRFRPNASMAAPDGQALSRSPDPNDANPAR